MRAAVEPLKRAWKLLNHGPTTLVSAAHGGKRNVMAAAWVMPIDFEPPKVAAVIAGDTYTRELIEASGEFVLNVPPRSMADVTYAVGSETGRDVDKFTKHGLAVAPAAKVLAPLVEGCVAWLECRVLPHPDLARDYDLFLAEVVAAWADDQAFRDGEWRFARDDLRTLHHVTKGAFFVTGERIDARAR